jgi:hypothetical protein
MPALTVRNFLRKGEPVPQSISRVLEEVCSAARFGPHSEARNEVAACLAKLYSDGYFTVEGLRQAFVAHVVRETSSPLRRSRGNPI